MESKKIVHLRFKRRGHDNADYYFGSLLAIYDSFSSDDLGITYQSLCAALRSRNPYENRNVVVNIGEIQRKKKTT